MKRIAIDMDDVLADTVSEHLARYNEEHGEAITKDDLQGKSLWDVVTLDRHDRLLAYLNADDFFEDLPVLPDSQGILREIAKEYEVYIATSAMEFPASFGPKFRWLRRHFSFLPQTNFVFCGDKGVIRADYLIDDLPRNLQRFVGEGILFSAPHNLHVSGYRRANNWREVAGIFLPEKYQPS